MNNRAAQVVETAEKLLCCAAIAYGAWLRVYRFWAPSLGLDELVTAWVIAGQDWAEMWQRCQYNLHPPLYFVAARLCGMVARSEFWLRLPSMLGGLGALGMLIVLVRRALGSRAALYAGALFALNSRAITETQNARTYGLALLWAAVSIWLFLAVLEDDRWPWVAGYSVAALAAGYTHLVYLSVVAGQVAVVAGMLLFGRDRPRSLRRLLAAQAVVLALLLPMAGLYMSAGGDAAALASWIPRPSLKWFSEFFTWPEIFYAGVVIPGLILALRRPAVLRPAHAGERGLLWLGVMYVLIFPAAIASAHLGLVNILHGRYLLPAVVGLLMLVGYVVSKTGEKALRLLLCAYLGFAGLFQVIVARTYGPWIGIFPGQDWRAAIRSIEKQYQPGDVVLLRGGLVETQYLDPSQPWVNPYLASPICGFYDSGRLRVVNLPWRAEDLQSSPFTAPARDQVRAASQVFVLMNIQVAPWDWELLQRWLEGESPPRQVERRSFGALRLRVYRRQAAAGG